MFWVKKKFCYIIWFIKLVEYNNNIKYLKCIISNENINNYIFFIRIN